MVSLLHSLGFLLGDQLADSWPGLCRPKEALQRGGAVTGLNAALLEAPALLGLSILPLRLQALFQPSLQTQ